MLISGIGLKVEISSELDYDSRVQFDVRLDIGDFRCHSVKRQAQTHCSLKSKQKMIRMIGKAFDPSNQKA